MSKRALEPGLNFFDTADVTSGGSSEETLEAPHDVVKARKVRYSGASSMYAWQLSQALYLGDRHGWTRLVSMQPHDNLLYREEEREMLLLCQDKGSA